MVGGRSHRYAGKMRAAISLAAFCAFFALAVAGINGAAAETLREKISKLHPLTLQYGVNNITINKWNVLIVRGLFHSEVAGGEMVIRC